MYKAAFIKALIIPMLFAICGIRAQELSRKMQIPPKQLNKYPKPKLTPPADHPRLLLRPNDIATIKQKLKLPQYQKDVKYFERVINDKKFSGALPKPQTEQGGNYSGTTLGKIDVLAFMYLLEKNPEYGQRAIKCMRAYLDSVVFAHRKVRFDVTRDVGHVLLSIAFVYDYCYPLLSAADKNYFIDKIEELAKTMEIGYPPYKQGSVTGHGGEAQLMRDILAAAIAVYNEEPRIYNMSAGRFFAEFIEPRNFFFKSGRHHQGDSYGAYRHMWELWAAWLFKRMSGVDVFSDDMRNILYNSIYIRRPDGQLIRQGDTTKSGYGYWNIGATTFLAANYFDNPYFKYISDKEEPRRINNQSPILFVIMDNPKLEAKSEDDLPLSRFFGDPLPELVARTGWAMGKRSPACVIDMRGAHTFFANHMHLDAGSFQIYYKGGLATDSGTYAGSKYGTPYDWSYNKRSIAHNTMLAYDPDAPKDKRAGYDGGQRYPNKRKEPKNLQQLLNDGYRIGSTTGVAIGPNTHLPLYSYLKTDLSKAYSDTIKKYDRQMCFMRFADSERPGVFFVFDRMQTSSQKPTKYWLLHGLNKPEINGSSYTFTRNDYGFSGKLCGTSLSPAETQIETIGGKGKDGWVFGKNYTPKKHTTESKGWRIQIAPKNKSEYDVFLNVLQPVDSNTQPLPISRLEGKNMLGALCADNAILFNKNFGLLDVTLNINIPATKTELKVLFCDLKPGYWSVSVNGNKADKQYQVNENAGVLFYYGKGGKLTLTYTKTKTLPLAKSLTNLKAPAPVKLPPVITIDGKDLKGIDIATSRNNLLVDLEQFCKAYDKISAKFSGKIYTLTYNKRKLLYRPGGMYVRFDGGSVRMPCRPIAKDNKIMFPTQTLAAFMRKPLQADLLAKEAVFGDFPPERSKYYWFGRALSNRNDKTHKAQNAIDYDSGTRWSGNGSGAWLVVGLIKPQKLSSVDIKWMDSTKRRARFKIQVSNTLKNWKTVFDGESDGKSPNFERYTFEPQTARYIRIFGLGNTKNEWNSICDVRVNRVK